MINYMQIKMGIKSQDFLRSFSENAHIDEYIDDAVAKEVERIGNDFRKRFYEFESIEELEDALEKVLNDVDIAVDKIHDDMIDLELANALRMDCNCEDHRTGLLPKMLYLRTMIPDEFPLDMPEIIINPQSIANRMEIQYHIANMIANNEGVATGDISLPGLIKQVTGFDIGATGNKHAFTEKRGMVTKCRNQLDSSCGKKFYKFVKDLNLGPRSSGKDWNTFQYRGLLVVEHCNNRMICTKEWFDKNVKDRGSYLELPISVAANGINIKMSK